jgi:cell wall-associated NlpC family hydrolase
VTPNPVEATAPDAAVSGRDAPLPPAATPALPPVLETALGLRGAPYRLGGEDPTGFDCSGFVQYVFARHNRPLPRQTQDQFRAGRAIDREEVRPGDLVFFETVSRGASHVGIALGDDSFVHAPSSRGVVRVERYTTDYWARRWVGARRLE